MAHRLPADPAPRGDTDEPADTGAVSRRDASSSPDRQAPEGGDRRFASPELQRLRSLLLQDDRTAIAELEREIGDLRDRVGNDAASGQALEGVLVDTLKRLHTTQAPDLRRALAPVVVKTIRSEVRNSREELVNALYPLTGKMVAAAMRDAVRKLTDNINESVERASNPMLLYARIRAKLGGKPVAAKLLERKRAIRINRAILINRVSGTVECSFSIDDQIDDDMVGGLISALSTFATQTYARSNSDLRMIELEGRQLLLRHSPLFVLALEVDGEPTPLQVEAVDALFMGLMTEQDADPDQIDEQRLEQFVRDVESWRPQKRRSYRRAVLLLLVAAACAWAGYHSWRTWTFEKQVADVQALVAAQDALNSFGVQVSGDQAANAITVRGLVPVGFGSDQFRQQAAGLLEADTGLSVALQPIEIEGSLSQRLAAGDATLEQVGRSQRALLAETQALRSALSQLQEQFAALQAGASQQVDGLGSRLSALETAAQDAQATATRLQDALSGLRAQDEAVRQDMAARDAARTGEVAALNAQLQGLTKQGADVQDKLDTVQAAMRRQREADATTLAALQARMDSEAVSTTQVRDATQQALAALNGQEQARLKAFVERSQLRFAKGATYLDPYTTAVALNGLADAIIALDKPLEILGHADSSGTGRENLARGLDRAHAVKSDLVALGVPDHLLKPRSMGATQAHRAPGPGSEDRRVTFNLE